MSSSAREAAFGSTPHRILRAAVEPEERWLVAVALGGQGHYAAAAAELERLVADPAVPLRVAAHAAVTRAAHLRQLGGHAAARPWDARGLRLAVAALRASATLALGARVPLGAPAAVALHPAASVPHAAASVPHAAASVPHAAAPIPHAAAPIPHAAAPVPHAAVVGPGPHLTAASPGRDSAGGGSPGCGGTARGGVAAGGGARGEAGDGGRRGPPCDETNAGAAAVGAAGGVAAGGAAGGGRSAVGAAVVGGTTGGGGPGGGPCDGLDAAAARVDALVGLAADAVGLGDPGGAERLLAAAAPALATHPSWRPATRAGWVRAELALVRGRPAAAVAPAEAALAAARRGGSRRHVLKSRIVLAVTRAAAGELSAAAAVTELDAAADECAGYGLLPLCWPAGLAALDLSPVPAAKPQVRINDQVASPAGSALGGRPDGTTRRRHAVRVALSVIEQRSDALGKRQMGESVWIPQPATLM